MMQANLQTETDSAMRYVVAALYKFTALEDYEGLQPQLLAFCNDQQIKGTLLLAEEGINGTIAGTRQGIDAVLAYLRADLRMADLEHKESYADTLPFHRMKVKLKKEIVTIGLPEVNPNKAVGQYVKPEDWNALISDPEVVLIDTRNQYEVDIGTFKYALDPKTTNFREFPEYVKKNLDPKKQKKVAMFCTGGIRCEKASAYMLSEGFEEVYHLQGGILKYLETVSTEQSLWEGDCFVFDSRVAVDNDLSYGRYDQCHGCRHPITEEEKKSPEYEEGVSCPYCFDQLTEKKRRSAAERQKQVKLAEARNQQHIGVTMEVQKQAAQQLRAQKAKKQ